MRLVCGQTRNISEQIRHFDKSRGTCVRVLALYIYFSRSLFLTLSISAASVIYFARRYSVRNIKLKKKKISKHDLPFVRQYRTTDTLIKAFYDRWNVSGFTKRVTDTWICAIFPFTRSIDVPYMRRKYAGLFRV